MDTCSRRGDCPLIYWSKLSSWMFNVCKTFRLKNTVTMNSFMLLSDYLNSENLHVPKLQLYAVAAMECSALLGEYYAPDRSDFVYICDEAYTSSRVGEAIEEIARHREGRVQFVTCIDVLNRFELENDEDHTTAKTIAILCVLKNPAFLTIPSEEFAEACLNLARNKPLSILEGQISFSLYALNKADTTELRLTQEEREVLVSFSERSGSGKTKSKVSCKIVASSTSLGDYAKKERLAETESSRIYSVTSSTGEFVVKKQGDDHTQEFFRELSILATCKHENIIGLKGFSLGKSSSFLGIEFGTDLSSLIHRRDAVGYMSWEMTYLLGAKVESLLKNSKRIADGIVRGVRYLHSVGIIHNDIKPQNIVVVEGVPKLIDFGISTTSILSKKDYRRFPTLIQTSWYRCPELLMLRNSDDEAILERIAEFKGYNFGPDVWSVGVILLEIETGIHPFSDAHLVQYKYSEHHCVRILENISYILDNTEPLLCIQNLEKRKRILGMLNYDPEKRVLV